MRILVAPDSFKGSLTAGEVAENIAEGIRLIIDDAEVIKVPMADGGEGTVGSMIDTAGGEIIYRDVTGPLGKTVQASFGLLGGGKTAVIEMAAASGLPLIKPEEADPSKTTTYGTGELIKAALDFNIEELIIGIGGSATNDGGIGMAQALGVKFLDNRGRDLGFGGGELSKLKSINFSGIDQRIKLVKVRAACDVENPLYGREGAAHVYGRQKGATTQMIEMLDRNLKHYADVILRETGRNISKVPGGGAAGGLGAGLLAFLDAELKPGVEIILNHNRIKQIMKKVDLVITGEGMIDGQSIKGKTPVGVARLAKKYDIPVVAIVGSVGSNVEKVYQEGIDAVFSIIQKPVRLEEALRMSPDLIQFTAQQVARVMLLNFTKK